MLFTCMDYKIQNSYLKTCFSWIHNSEKEEKFIIPLSKNPFCTAFLLAMRPIRHRNNQGPGIGGWLSGCAVEEGRFFGKAAHKVG